MGNVTFKVADAQVHRFGRERFDLAVSRFGTMFFADPVAAFGNIGRALRPGGRLVMMVWQAAGTSPQARHGTGIWWCDEGGGHVAAEIGHWSDGPDRT